jgi:hypothetical protein
MQPWNRIRRLAALVFFLVSVGLVASLAHGAGGPGGSAGGAPPSSDRGAAGYPT